MLVECTYGPVTTEVMGTAYTFAADEHGRNVAEVWNPKHLRALLAVVHYRAVSRDPDSEATPLSLTEISPAYAEIGGIDMTMVCSGFGFTPESVIVFNGGDEVTEFISDVQVSTIVKPSLATTPGLYPVFVRNGDEESEQLQFEFTGVAPEAEDLAPEVDPEEETDNGDGDELIPVTSITGIGEATEAKLADVGITDARQIAALTDEEVATLDMQLGLAGRITRDKWVEQAKALTA